MLVMLTELLSGLALFLFGMKFMSEGLQKAAGDKMRVILDRVTKNRFIAVIFGAIFTAIIQSSGATTVMEVSFVNAGLLTLVVLPEPLVPKIPTTSPFFTLKDTSFKA